jgi:mRNA degradation ribonuclease J1/J2
VILDFGAYLIRQKSDWTGAVPDIVENLSYCKDICITHHHLDHLDAIVPYVERGLIGHGHTLHLTREVMEMAKDKLTKMSVAKHKYPKFSILNGTDAFDLKDENGVKRMTVLYGADAVPHSARCTPFTVYGRNGDDILGSYTYLGDMRYEDEWFALHDSPFWNPVKFMSEREPKLNKDHLLPTYSEIDLTSVKREGRSPAERQVEDNLTHVLKNWLQDRHVGVPMIGTADGRRETLLRVANRAERKMTAFGAAVEFIFRIANKHGVNPYRLDRPEEGKYTGLRDYLTWHAEQLGIKATTFKSRTSKTVKEWFKNDPPGTILAVMSGSQGNPIEFESMTYKLADRRSFFDANPKHSKTALPADLKDWAIVFTQGAIPGNSAYQRKLIGKLADRGMTVLEAFGDNIRVHNPSPQMKERILNDLKTLGREAEIEADGALLIADMPIHASGHGRRGDMRLWLNKLQSKLYGGHHTDDPETVLTAYDTIEQEGKKHPGKIFQNYERVQIANDGAFVIGRVQPSVIMTRELAEDGKHYNKRLEATRMMAFDDRSPHNDLGLRGKTNGAFEIHFGVEDAESVKRHTKQTQKPDNDDRELETKPFRFGRGLARIPTPPWQPPSMGG